MDIITIAKQGSAGFTQLHKLQCTLSMIIQMKTKYIETLKAASANLLSLDSKDSCVHATLNQYSQGILMNANISTGQLNKAEVEVIEGLQVFKENYAAVSKNVSNSIDAIMISIEKTKFKNEKSKKMIIQLINEMDELFVRFQENQQHCSTEHKMKFENDLKALESSEKSYQLAIQTYNVLLDESIKKIKVNLDELSALNESKENYIKSSIVKFERVMKLYPEEFEVQPNPFPEKAQHVTIGQIALELTNKKLAKEIPVLHDLTR